MLFARAQTHPAQAGAHVSCIIYHVSYIIYRMQMYANALSRDKTRSQIAVHLERLLLYLAGIV